MIKKPQFLNLIRQGDFKELFISELGWNRYRGQSQLPSITVDDKNFNFSTIAERNGFQVLYSEVEEIPTQSLAKKIDTKLRRQALDYICIYRQENTAHDLWVVPVRTNEKRDLVLVEYDKGNAEVLYQKIDGITFAVDEKTNIVDLRSKVQTAFAVNSEKITKDFYAGFKKQHKAFAELIEGIDDHIAAKDNRNKQWYASVILNRLMFCYFIQKKGFLDLDVNYLRDKLNYVRAHEGEDKFYNFYRSFLRRLFHDGLNTPKHSRDFEKMFGKIPYLNGGMFDEHKLEADYADIDIPDEAFISLFDFFDKWNWHLDTRLTASGRDINPDVLGYIFEQYINDRAQMGAYYTKEDITEYIGRNCILPFLFDKVKNATKDSAKEFEADGFVWHTLRDSADRYIFDAVKKGYKDFNDIPESISRGIITESMRKEYSETPIGELPVSHVPLAELRSEWNTRTPEPWGLPNEIWRETIDRLQRCGDILGKIERGEITSINDFITYNLDIRNFAADLLGKADSRFVGWFYHALQQVTILDPTCGSGAFLFAAMNILEPLYEICIDRMQEFNHQNKHLFKEELAEITDKYRSNIQYFIFKSIILRNLYGVDIMVEATEIAKLRLFLKMVAVVDVDKRAENLGLDPLPDIDFNIRCGNTLVGYANKEQLEKDLSFAKDVFEEVANQEFKKEIEEEMQKVARAYRIFKEVQLRQTEDMAAFKQAKNDLRARLIALNDNLNRRLYLASTGYQPKEGEDFAKTKAYRDWLVSHQPFHWLAEFYQIIEGNGGFDVIIGNPPYVETNIVEYGIFFSHETYSNLYAYCLVRGAQIGNENAYNGMIVPMSLTSIRDYQRLRHNVSNLYKRVYVTNHAIRPVSLFTGVSQRVSILFANNSKDTRVIFTTKYLRYKDPAELFKVIQFYQGYFDKERSTIVPKLGSSISNSIFQRIHSQDKEISRYLSTNNGVNLYFKDYGETYWIFPFNFNPCLTPIKSFKTLKFLKEYIDNIFVSLNSSLYYFFYIAISDCWHFGSWHMYQFPLCISELELLQQAEALKRSMQNNRIIRFDKRALGKIYEYKVSKSKPIIDEIDKVLARHYGFSDEELDFIINYDIKYRMGDELNND